MSDTWRISKTSYYADWITIPIIALGVLIADVSYRGLTLLSPLMFALGALAMSFVEYGSHRWAFHNPKLFRRDHWIHHIRSADYVGVPAWQTFLAFVFLLAAAWGSAGLDIGGSFFVGFCAYYFTYIAAHDGFHHGELGLSTDGFWHNRRKAHLVHHAKGREVNFGVVTPWWDMLFGTYYRPY